MEKAARPESEIDSANNHDKICRPTINPVERLWLSHPPSQRPAGKIIKQKERRKGYEFKRRIVLHANTQTAHIHVCMFKSSSSGNPAPNASACVCVA
jgi:hypothetical protein